MYSEIDVLWIILYSFFLGAAFAFSLSLMYMHWRIAKEFKDYEEDILEGLDKIEEQSEMITNLADTCSYYKGLIPKDILEQEEAISIANGGKR